MSARKNQQDLLNLSGFSPIRLKNNVANTIPLKSPGKDYGIYERIETGKNKIIVGFDRWKLAVSSGFQYISSIHNLKDKARNSDGNIYPQELEPLCTKLKIIVTVFEDILSTVKTFRSEITSSINLLTSTKDNDELTQKLTAMLKLLDNLIITYESSYKMKQYLIENIAHAKTSEESNLLIAAWSCDSNINFIYKLVNQLRISPCDSEWISSS